jgi:hypothetical protein
MSHKTGGEASVSRQPLKVQVQSRWIAPIALAVAVISIGVAIWALVQANQSNQSNTAAPTSQQTADAKGRACTAYNTVRAAVSGQTHTDLGTDPVAVDAVAANARLSMTAGASYLLASLDPATPGDLAAGIRAFANDLQDISMYAQAGMGNQDPAQAARLRDGDTANAHVAELCK